MVAHPGDRMAIGLGNGMRDGEAGCEDPETEKAVGGTRIGDKTEYADESSG
jgi:hypothetical protein